MTIGVIAKIPVQKGKEKEFEVAFGALQNAVREKEKGCLLYELFKGREAGDHSIYVVMEKYADEEALAAHRKTEHFRAAGASLATTVAGAPDVTVVDAVS